MNSDDLMVAINSSGNSKNICNAINVVHDRNAKVITFTGFRSDNYAKQEGYYAIVITNQNGIARGLFSEEELQKMNQMLMQPDYRSKNLKTFVELLGDLRCKQG